MSWRNEMSIAELCGKTIKSVEGLEDGSERVTFVTDDGTYLMFHDQDCCEHVRIEDVSGETDLVGQTVLQADERESDSEEGEYGSKTWTFYTIGTVRGRVDIRWLGESNGYYSERVSFVKLDD